jgi:shikimate kinase
MRSMILRPTGNNVVLIGMPGVGKSTLGVLLAKAMGLDFLDTDVRIQAREGRSLQAIIDTDGRQVFGGIEERSVLELSCVNTVIATGGSVIYSGEAMQHLQSLGWVVHLHLPLSLLHARLRDFGARGVLMTPGQTLEQLFAERAPLYRRYADASIDCSRKTHDEAVEAIVRCVPRATVA